MVPLPPATAETTPDVPWAASPMERGHSPSGSDVQTSPAVAYRYSVKLVVVPESSARCTGVTARSGSVASVLSAAMAGSFHLVIVPANRPAMVAASRLSSSTPSTLKITAMGETYVGSWTMFVSSTQPSNGPASTSSRVNARSEPAKVTAPAWNDS